MDDNMELTLAGRLDALDTNISELDKITDSYSKYINKTFDRTKVRGDIVSNTEVNHVVNQGTDINKGIQQLKDKLSNISNNSLTGVQTQQYSRLARTLDDISSQINRLKKKQNRILGADSGRLNARDYSDDLKSSLNEYKRQYDDTTYKARETTKNLRSVINRINNAKQKKDVSYTFDKELRELVDLLIGEREDGEDNLTHKTSQDLLASTSRRLDTINTLRENIQRRKDNIRKGSYSLDEVASVRKEIAEDEKRIHDLLLYNSKDADLLQEITYLQQDVTNMYKVYQQDIKSKKIGVRASKYSFRGIMHQHAFRLIGSLGYNVTQSVMQNMYKGNQLRTTNYNNGVAQLMFNQANNGNVSKRMDNTILKGITKQGIQQGVSSTDTTAMLGAYVGSNRTGNLSDYKNQVSEYVKFSSETNAGTESTQALISAIGQAGGTDPANNLKSLYGALMNADMLSRSSEQVQALSQVLGNTNNIGNISTGAVNRNIATQQAMSNTKDSALQGQQGATAWNMFSNTVTDTNNNLMRNMFASVFNLDVGNRKDNAKLSYLMENARQDPALLSKGVKKLLKYYNNDEKAVADILSSQSGGSLSTHQALKLVKLVEKGKLSKKELNKVAKKDKEKEEGSPLEKALKGSGQFTLNFYLSVANRNAQDASMGFDTVRGTGAKIFQNHPVLGMLANAGGSIVYNIALSAFSGYLQTKVENHILHGGKKKDNNNDNDSNHHGNTPNTDDNTPKDSSMDKETKTSKENISNSHEEKIHTSVKSKSKGKGMLLTTLAIGGASAIGGLLSSNDDVQASSAKKPSKKVSSKNVDRRKETKEDEVLDRALRLADMAKTIPNLIKAPTGNSSSEVSEITGQGLEMLKQVAKEVSKQTGIKAELLYAQMVHETGGLTSKVSKEDNNFGGIQYFDSMNSYGVSISKGTVVGDGSANGVGHYVHFNSAEDFAKFYAGYLSAVYPELKNANTIRDYATILKKHGYFEASVDEYIQGMQGYVDQYNSNAYGGFYNTGNVKSLIDDRYSSYTGRRPNSGYTDTQSTLSVLSSRVEQQNEHILRENRMIKQQIKIKPKYNVHAQINNTEYDKQEFINAISNALEKHTKSL